jgi:hypothetical protein
MKKKATVKQAWMLTVAAILDLIALVFMSSSDTKLVLLAGFAGCEGILIVCAVAAWQKYFEQLIEEKTSRNQG